MFNDENVKQFVAFLQASPLLFQNEYALNSVYTILEVRCFEWFQEDRIILWLRH